jgi:hypothetical protein
MFDEQNIPYFRLSFKFSSFNKYDSNTLILTTFLMVFIFIILCLVSL